MTAPTYGKTRDGEILYWPDKSFLSVAVPAPLEQALEFVAKCRPHLGRTPQEVAVYLLRCGLIDMMSGHKDNWFPDHGRYSRLKKGER